MSKKQAVSSRLKAERVQEKLKQMPGWRLLEGERAIDRVREFGYPGEAEAFTGFVTRMAICERQRVAIEVSGTEVVVTLHGPAHRNCRGGLTEATLDLAARIG